MIAISIPSARAWGVAGSRSDGHTYAASAGSVGSAGWRRAVWSHGSWIWRTSTPRSRRVGKTDDPSGSRRGAQIALRPLSGGGVRSLRVAPGASGMELGLPVPEAGESWLSEPLVAMITTATKHASE